MAQLLSNLPVGAKVKFGKYSVNGETAQDLTWLIAAKGHVCTPSYPSDSITLLTEKIIDLRCVDAKEPTNSNTDRIAYGNNRYSVSNIDQWLNKDSAAGSWYSATHSADQPPDATNATNNTRYDTRPGFLNAFTAAEKNAIRNTTIRVVKPYVDGGGYEDISRKVFLPARVEVGLGNESTIVEGSPWSYFSNGGNLSAYLTSQAFNNSLSTSKPTAIANEWYWWLRSPRYNDSHITQYVITNGAGGGVSSIGYFGIRPALNILSTLKVSDAPDSDGCYTFIWNTAPVISGIDINLGIMSQGFTGTYSISDEDNDVVTVTEAIDGVQIRSLVAKLGETITYGVTANTWLALSNGTHALTIRATDGIDTTIRTYTFTKLVESFKIQNSTPWAASTMPSRIILVVTRNIPPTSKFKVEVCNNGYDTSPTWEDCTDAVKSGLVHVFTNTTKTAANWGVLVRVTVSRNGATGACYVSAIGGNFE